MPRAYSAREGLPPMPRAVQQFEQVADVAHVAIVVSPDAPGSRRPACVRRRVALRALDVAAGARGAAIASGGGAARSAARTARAPAAVARRRRGRPRGLADGGSRARSR